MKKKDNSGKRWTSTEIEKLIKLIKGNTPTKLIACMNTFRIFAQNK